MNKLAPIVLFTYNRLWHTQMTVQYLQKNILSEQSDLIIFSDAGKNEKDNEDVQKVREYLRSITGFKSVEIRENKINKGLAESVIDGVSSVVEKYGSIIVLEDDLLTSPYFLTFMNEALEMYKNDDIVCNVQGHTHILFSETSYLIDHADSWGWGTWQRAWNLFEPDGKKLLQQIKANNLSNQFDLDGSYPYVKMLQKQIDGENNSWAIRWKASLFINNRLAINAGHQLVSNIGFDGSGTHCGKINIYPSLPLCEEQLVLQKKAPIMEDKRARILIKKSFKRSNSKFSKGLAILKYYLKTNFNRH